MLSFLVGLSLFSANVFAAEPFLKSYVVCEFSENNVDAAVGMLNSRLEDGTVAARIQDEKGQPTNGRSSPLVSVRAPYSVSAPIVTYVPKEGYARNGYTVCVTVTGTVTPPPPPNRDHNR